MVLYVVLYARVSLSSEESVSVERQLVAGRSYAAARGWVVVGEFVDDGVSATLKHPERRAEWRALMTSQLVFDVVVIWKVDRLARRVSDFLDADKALRQRGAALVAVDDPVDMTTAQGRAFTVMLAVFAELEAASFGARVRSARMQLIRSGRAPGGFRGYGWMHVPNPDGPGYVVTRDPERVKWLRGMIRRALRGDSLFSICRWLERSHAPFPRYSKGRNGRWQIQTVRTALRNPLVAGMSHYPYGQEHLPPEQQVLRHPNGKPVIRRDLALITATERERLLDVLASSAKGPRSKHPKAPFVEGLVWCGGCGSDRPMVARTSSPAVVMQCPECRAIASLAPLSAAIERVLLSTRGTVPMWHRHFASPEQLAAAEELERLSTELDKVARALTADRADTSSLNREMGRLKRARTAARRATGPAGAALEPLNMTLEQVWLRCETTEQRRHLVNSNIERIVVAPGQWKDDNARLQIIWRALGTSPIAPPGVESNEPARSRFYDPRQGWITVTQGTDIITAAGFSNRAFLKAIADGRIEKRGDGRRNYPSLALASVHAYVESRRAEQAAHEAAGEPEWISRAEAGRLVGCSEGTIGWALIRGEISRRPIAHRGIPAVSRASVLAYASARSANSTNSAASCRA
ncbi:MAG TPA: recombinase family protein [Nocardioides sp.]|nr:hypothetical protein [Nocardioides sp.]HRI94185.1 recombinase family protein [Nocardioides sp.]HRK44178.1 recombinase family protein [Nocardioides sp.]